MCLRRSQAWYGPLYICTRATKCPKSSACKAACEHGPLPPCFKHAQGRMVHRHAQVRGLLKGSVTPSSSALIAT